MLSTSLVSFKTLTSSRKAVISRAIRSFGVISTSNPCDTTTAAASWVSPTRPSPTFSKGSLKKHYQSRSFVSYSDDDTTSGNDENHTYLTGTVKFYLRDKLYGFIVPDDPMDAGGHNEVWFHRTGIRSQHSFDEFPSRPYLLKQERVKFRIKAPTETDSGGQSPTATDVTFENGREPPLFRKNYLASMQKGEGTRLGRTILELFENSTDDNNNLIEEQQLWQQVKEAVAKSQAMIREAKEKSDQFGQIDVKTGDRADNNLATIPKESG